MSDTQYEEATVSEVEKNGDGWAIKRSDGWSFFVPPDSPVQPRVGMTARFYGRGIGYAVRGLYLDGEEVFYRTEEEDKEKSAIDLYGADASDWLRRWDEGRSVWSIVMGGIGPGYEQAIQVTVAELLRHMLDAGYDADAWEDSDAWQSDREKIRGAAFQNETIGALGLSGAQFGAALGLAARIYWHGPRAIMDDPQAKDRHIQVSKSFPVG